MQKNEAEHHGAFPNMGDGGGGRPEVKFILDSLGSLQPMSSNGHQDDLMGKGAEAIRY